MDIKLGVSKFRNPSNFCYLNSILAILQQTPFFVEYFITKSFKRDLEDGDYNEKVSYQLYNILKSSLENDDNTLNVRTFRKLGKDIKPDLFDGEQKDSQELFNYLIDKLSMELSTKVDFIDVGNIDIDKKDYSIKNILAIKNYKNFIAREYNLVKKLFTGLITSQVKCLNCKNITYCYEPFTTLSLILPEQNNSHLDDCFKKTFNIEEMDMDNRYNCSFCCKRSLCEKKLNLTITPEILVIHLKRFNHNCSKNKSFVDYPLNIDMSYYTDGLMKRENKYKLFGVNIHKGSEHGGHYYSYVLNRYDNKWKIFNDESEVRNISKSKIIDKDAYMLFYYKE